MAAVVAKRIKRVAAGQRGFLPLNHTREQNSSRIGKRKRVNKNKKKNWNKYSDIQDIEDFLDDVRLQERATGGLLSEKPDDGLFFVDTGDQKKVTQEAPVTKRGKSSKSLRVDLILQHDSLVPSPKDILAHQQPNAKKLRRISQRVEKQVAKGLQPRSQKRLQRRKAGGATSSSEKSLPNDDPSRPFYDIWGQEEMLSGDAFYLEQTKKKPVKRPDRLNEKPSALPAVEIIGPGGSYNPDFFDHQALLLEAHMVEEKKQKEELKLAQKLAVRKEDIATEETIFQEQVEGLVEEDDEEEDGPKGEEEPKGSTSAVVRGKKTERQRKREKAEKEKEKRKRTQRELVDQRQQLFQLRSIRAELKGREQRTRQKQALYQAQKEAQKFRPQRLGKLKFQAPDLEVQLSDELSGSLRALKPEGSILKDRFKSLQKRNIIEPRERAKFIRRNKVKYVEKRAFKAIT